MCPSFHVASRKRAVVPTIRVGFELYVFAQFHCRGLGRGKSTNLELFAPGLIEHKPNCKLFKRLVNGPVVFLRYKFFTDP